MAKKLYDTQVTIPVSSDFKARLEAMADAQGMTATGLCRELLMLSLRRLEANPGTNPQEALLAVRLR